MNTERFNYEQKNLIDLKIRQTRAEFELNFSILTYENLEKMKYFNQNYKPSLFLQSLLSIENNELFKFIEKANSDNIYNLFCDSKDKKIAYFLKNIENFAKLNDDEIIVEKNKIEKDIRQLEGAIADIEDMMLACLPDNKFRS